MLMGFTFDPAPGLFRTKARSRHFECERMTAERGTQLRPGQVREARPRGDFVGRSVVVCTERLLRRGLRVERDEAILSALSQRADDVASAASALRPDLRRRTWLVDTHYGDSEVAAKISFATKNALMSQGLPVSDRVPMLGAGDVAVLTRMEPAQAYVAACQRYYAAGSMGDDEALLAVVSRDPRETVLHAGLCTRGQWTWLR